MELSKEQIVEIREWATKENHAGFKSLLDTLDAPGEAGKPAAELPTTIGCPHGRPSSAMCPHCLGINSPQPETDSAFGGKIGKPAGKGDSND